MVTPIPRKKGIPIKLRIFEYPITNTEYPMSKFISVLHRLEIESWILDIHFPFLLFLSAFRPAQMSVPQYVLWFVSSSGFSSCIASLYRVPGNR